MGLADATALVAEFRAMSAGAQGIWLFGTIIVSGQALKWFGQWMAWRRLSIEERQANREGFTAQVELLSTQLRSALDRLSALQGRHDALQNEHDDYRALCRAETDQLRGQIQRLEDDLAGLRRARAARSVAFAHDLVPERAPHAAASAERVAKLLGGPDPARG